MKTAIFVLFSLAGVTFAQGAKQQPQTGPKEVKKLGSVTWNLQTHKLEWVVQKGSTVNGKFVPQSEDRYEISPDAAVMSFSNQNRGFTQKEAENLQHLLDVLSLYCAESVVWWNQGKGVPLPPGALPPGALPPGVQGPDAKPNQSPKPGQKPTKVDDKRKDNPPVPYHVADSDYIASLQPAR